jgi:hypothetical protein
LVIFSLFFLLSFSGKKGVTLLDTQGGGEFFFPDTTSSFVKHLASVPSLEEGQSTSQQNNEDERRNQQLTGRRSLLPSSLDNNNNNNNSNNKPSANSLSPVGAAAPVGGLVALAKAGRISRAQNLFDVEVTFFFFSFQFSKKCLKLYYFCLDNWK